MTRRQLLALLAGLPLVGRFVPKADPLAPVMCVKRGDGEQEIDWFASPPPKRFRVVDEPPAGTIPTDVWRILFTGDTHRIDGIAGPVSAVFPIRGGRWVEILPGAHWIVDKSGVLIDGDGCDGFFELRILEEPPRA